MLLTIDIENKITSFGIFKKDKLMTSFNIMTDTNESADEIGLKFKLILNDKGFDLKEIDNIIISNVVPELSSVYEKISQNIIGRGPIFIGSGVKTGINIRCDNPREVGTDRIIRAVAASSNFKSDCIIIYASTITTIDYINSDKVFMGGLIMPGIDLYQKSIFNESAKLPQVEIRKTDEILGKNTTSSIQAGIYKAYSKAIDGIVAEIISEYSIDEPSIVVTGIHADLLDNKNYMHIPDLGLNGLKLISNLN